MARQLVIVVLAALLGAAACGPAPQTTSSANLRSCDDGGDGGVVLHGVCL
jgi:hypothetical protein